MKTIIKQYDTLKKYNYDSKRMVRRGYHIEHEMIIDSQLQVEYSK